ncbi:3-isopropylmalate dehydratase small subunit [Kyrpidia sp.]|uniref:3-isopropylmalate dehydratase small subunit n=1 Tax=Kyrpidia sp. TaxID=2073077 RepID=UPI002589702F|nr:3-isopropylmalate dehydratase small subunit [Kyrpidia sp.]MCL6574890.1 3-isopropylmalate dehydratase small subunit [Kyrpidia sp.]
MEPFVRHEGLVLPLDRVNVDTDQIIPKQFLKRIQRTGFGQFLFYDWRFREDGSPDPEFILNQPEYREASILLARDNFGCGSSREHAPWALKDYGFRVIIAPSFADIFYNNCFKNGLLPLVLPGEAVNHLFDEAGRMPGGYRLTVDLESQEVRDNRGWRMRFEIDPFRRESLLKGLDDIGMTLEKEDRIARYERGMPGYLIPREA